MNIDNRRGNYNTRLRVFADRNGLTYSEEYITFPEPASIYRFEVLGKQQLFMKIVWSETMTIPFNEFTHTNIEYIRTRLLKEGYGKYRTNSLRSIEFLGTTLMPAIRKVHFNPPLTIVIWDDGTKTFVKAHDEDFDAEKGLAMAISKKYFNNKYSYKEAFEKWIPKKKCEYDKKEDDMLKKLIDACEDFKKKLFREDVGNLQLKMYELEDATEVTCAACSHVHDSDICEDCHSYSNYEKKEEIK